MISAATEMHRPRANGTEPPSERWGPRHSIDERRSARRFPYPALVRVNCRPGTGLDISTSGIAVLFDQPLAVGELVTVTLGGGFGRPDEISTAARVARVALNAQGYVVGLEFVA